MPARLFFIFHSSFFINKGHSLFRRSTISYPSYILTAGKLNCFLTSLCASWGLHFVSFHFLEKVTLRPFLRRSPSPKRDSCSSSYFCSLMVCCGMLIDRLLSKSRNNAGSDFSLFIFRFSLISHPGLWPPLERGSSNIILCFSSYFWFLIVSCGILKNSL